MTQNNDKIIEHSKSNDLNSKKPFDENTFLTIIVLILIINQFSRKNPFSSREQIWPEDEYTVTMGNKPAFPLDKEEQIIKKEKKSLLNIQNQQDLYSMVNSLKPYMSIKNRRIITVFEKWQVLLKDLNDLSTSFNSENEQLELSSVSSKNIVKFFYDLKPFIHSEYHDQIQKFSDGINSILEIQKNISNLQNTLSQINSIDDQAKKVNHLVDGLQPFMGENQKKTVNQLKNISQVLDMVKLAENISSEKDTQQSITADEPKDKDNKNSQLMEILDIFDSPPKETKEEEHKENLDEIKEQPEIQEQDNEMILEDTLEHEEEEYEEIFEETLNNKEQDEIEGPELELKEDIPKTPENLDDEEG